MGPINEEYGQYFSQPRDFDFNENTAKLSYSHVLFLDFDGVLHPEFIESKKLMCFAKNFFAAIREVDPDGTMPIVISSSWRVQNPLQRLRSHFDNDIAKQIVGSTPDFLPETKITDGWRQYAGQAKPVRQREIEAWMAKHSPYGAWLAVDDGVSMFEKGCAKLFAVPSRPLGGGYGLTDELMPSFVATLKEFKEITPASKPASKRRP